MDQTRTGELIRQFRTKMGLTQKQLADRINVSDKAVSKWETGSGCPDISLLAALADVFGTDMGVLISGEIDRNESEKGDMKKLRFYVCGDCGNIITSATDAAVTCCGSRLAPLEAKKADDDMCRAEHMDGELYVTSSHEMTKEHHISFAAYLNDSTLMMFRQYPEWEMHFTMPVYRSGKLLVYCNKCGLLYRDMEDMDI